MPGLLETAKNLVAYELKLPLLKFKKLCSEHSLGWAFYVLEEVFNVQ